MIPGFNGLTCYEVLDISPGAEAKEIQEGYYRVREIFAKSSLASYSLYTEPERQEIQQVIDDAYRTLIDPKSREEYDRYLQQERVKSIKAGKALQEALPLLPRVAGEKAEAGAEAGEEAGEEAAEIEPVSVSSEAREPGEEREEAEGPAPAEPPAPRPGRITAADQEEDIEEAAAIEREERDKILEPPADETTAPAPESSPGAAPSSLEPSAATTEAPEGGGAEGTPPASAIPPAGPSPSADQQAAPSPAAPEKETPPSAAVLPTPAREKTPPPMPARDKTPAPAPAKPPEPPHRPGRPWERDHKPLPGEAPVTSAGVKRSELKPPLPARGREHFEDTVLDVPIEPARACPMDFIETGVSGKFFKERREAKGMTLDQVWETTKIRRPILEAIENEAYSKLPAAVFLKGMLKSYARLLGLDDPEAAIKGYIDRMTAAKQWID